ncbi:MAG: ribose-phosphate pyrophosphokinase [Fimbriimonadales bacterium]
MADQTIGKAQAAIHMDIGEPTGMKLFTGNANPELSERIAESLGTTLGQIRCSRFSDGEIRVQIEESTRGDDVFIIQPTCAPVNDNLMELLIMLDAFRRASARRISVVMPYYGYARQDKKVKPREPVSARLVANLITNAGADRIMCVDLHADQIQGFFDLPVDHLYAGPLIGQYLIEHEMHLRDTVVVSPDVAGVPRARRLAEQLGAPIAIIAKRRPEPNKVDIMEIIGEVEGKTCIMIDDMIDTAGSIVQGADALFHRGAVDVVACCTHGVLSGDAPKRLESSGISLVVCTDTVPIDRTKRFPKLTVLPAAPLLAEAIRRVHLDMSVSSLFDRWG